MSANWSQSGGVGEAPEDKVGTKASLKIEEETGLGRAGLKRSAGMLAELLQGPGTWRIICDGSPERPEESPSTSSRRSSEARGVRQPRPAPPGPQQLPPPIGQGVRLEARLFEWRPMGARRRAHRAEGGAGGGG